ncbi:hypothetical protein CR513_20716, partial [Mucuna pruriens]
MENILHSHCHILGQLCSIIIYRGNNVNIANSRLLEKLKLPTQAHPRAYKLQWLNSEEELATNKVLCDVVPMEATHILLGQSWPYDCKVTYNKDEASKGTLVSKEKNDKKESLNGKEMLITSKRVVRKVLLAKKDHYIYYQLICVFNCLHNFLTCLQVLKRYWRAFKKFFPRTSHEDYLQLRG